MDRFVSEKDIEENRKKRQEEWDRVRQPHEPEKPPEAAQEVYDPRSLYEKLQAQKQAKQEEFEEARKFKNQLRGLDEDEAKFLEKVDAYKEEVEKQQWLEEKRALDEFKKEVAVMKNSSSNAAELLTGVTEPCTSGTKKSSNVSSSKQKQLLKGAIVRKRTATSIDKPTDNGEKEEPEPPKIPRLNDSCVQKEKTSSEAVVYPSVLQVGGVRPSFKPVLGSLIGVSEDSDGAETTDGSHLNEITAEAVQEYYDNFFEDVFVECEDKYGEIEEMNVCDNLGDHLVGNVYVKELAGE
ncbi:unnamed protein product [Cyprideis torosa]|uniref:Uncharacterized protein n=1 Tax=Cyprideis torosa TaxID=163714 RepID=A0A7R8WAM3_9CRUS|nr:unnamed protein product [Cyprideis torosa]CAG0885464.1 unnamed protein product [Cyprideis torosa]